MVKVYRLQALVGLSVQDLAFRYQTIAILKQAASTGSLTDRSRGRKLDHQLTKQRRHGERKRT